MRRPASLAIACGIAAATMAAQEGQGTASPIRQALQIEALRTGGTPSEREEARRVLERVGAGGEPSLGATPLTQDRLARIQREVEERLKPVPVQNGRLTPQLQQGDSPYFRALSADAAAQIERRALSVGRLEVHAAGGHAVYGTAFVIGDSLLATNCHVVAELSRFADGHWQLTGDVRVDFADGPGHADAWEFRVTAIDALPSQRGLDVAVLRVAPRSVDGTRALPAPLTLSRRQVVRDWATQGPIPVGVIGYPSLSGGIRDNFSRLRALSRGRFAKFYSPGAIDGIGTIEHIEMLMHAAGTQSGSSGSPVFDLDTLQVVGVHHCCVAAGPPPDATLAAMPCSVIVQRPATFNEAISSFQIFSTSTLAGRFAFAP